MFVENYRQETGGSIMAGGDATQIPYPKLSAEDWHAWKTFLPVRSANLDKSSVHSLQEDYTVHGIPYSLIGEVQKATGLFDHVEVWRKRDINKDPIAVGVLDGERYLIARWGMERLLPFEAIKKVVPLIIAWRYASGPAGAIAGIGLGLLAWGMLL